MSKPWISPPPTRVGLTIMGSKGGGEMSRKWFTPEQIIGKVVQT